MNINHIHFYVEDAIKTRDWLIGKMGFQFLGENIEADTLTKLLSNGDILFLVSAALTPNSPVYDYLKIHPPGVIDIAFIVPDLDSILSRILSLGVNIVQRFTTGTGHLQAVKIQGWGDYYHTLIRDARSSHFSGDFAPKSLSSPLGILGIDHVVLNVNQGQMAAAVSWYEELFNFQIQQSFSIQTDQSGLYSKALIDATGQIQFNINEPSNYNSQIQTFLDHNRGSGIQHVAILTQNIFHAITQLRMQGLDFLPISKDYYHALKDRSRKSINFAIASQEWQALEDLEILLDWSDHRPESLLMQTFTLPIFDQPTFFFEFIERRNQMKGFGERNFLALFQSMETHLS
jgi:4-hydroxyphenylpyruvate dioxygenase